MLSLEILTILAGAMILAVQTESDDSAIGDYVTHVTLLIETQKANFIMDGMRHLIRVIMRPDLTKKRQRY